MQLHCEPIIKPNQEMEKREEVFSKSVRAGKRTYFFDVKTTRGNDYYLTITESKKQFDDNGGFHFDKHKIFLYKEDFEKFENGFDESIAFIKNALKNGASLASIDSKTEIQEKEITDIAFEDL